ncbi:NCS2 family permease, partial [Enterococcus faecalis]
MPVTYSISEGIALGLIFNRITMIAAKRGKEVSPIMYGLYFVFVGFMWILNAQ